MEHGMDQTATWWWGGELRETAGSGSSPVIWVAFLESFPKNAVADAVFRVSLTNGREAWQVCTTALEIITRRTSSRNNVASRLRAALEEQGHASVTVNGQTGFREYPQIIVPFGDREGACIDMTTKSDVDTISSLLMTYLIDIGNQTKVEESLLKSVHIDRAELLRILEQDVEAKKNQNQDMAKRMRRLLVAKRQHYTSSKD
jgi:hypothetical protein